MVRLPRLFGKKRGDRRTGSPEWGRFTEALLSTGLLLAGLLHGFIVLAGIVRPTWRIGFGVPMNDAAPSPASLWLWLLGLLLPVVLVVMGATGLVRSFRGWGRSEERRAAMGRLPDLLAPVAGAVEADNLPSVPAFDHLTNSPGTTLAFRLPTENADGWSLFVAGLFAVSWNAMLVVFVVGGALGMRSESSDPLLAMIVIVFAAVGIGAILLFIRRFLEAYTIGPTNLEVSTMPLEPGDRCVLRLTQAGTCTLDSLSVFFEQEEQSTYRQGTDIRIERRVVARLPVTTWQDLRIGPASRFDGDAAFTVPSSAMHSFVSDHNGVSWRLVVEGEMSQPSSRRFFPFPTLRRFAHAFPVVVTPSGFRDSLAKRQAVDSDAQRAASARPTTDSGRSTSRPPVVVERPMPGSFDPRREVRVLVAFDRASKNYSTGESVTIHYVVDGLGADAIEGVERSVLWYTEGKGDEDLGVVQFERIGFRGRGSMSWGSSNLDPAPAKAIEMISPRVSDEPSPLASGSLSVRLPVSPLSYEGIIVKVSWCVRIRVFFARNAGPFGSRSDGSFTRPQPPRDFVSEHVFQVGKLPPVGFLSEMLTA